MKNMIFALVLMFSTSVFAELVAPASAEEVPVPNFINLDNVDFSGAPDTHEVVRGDTLWDISEKYLKSPWYWPKVWSINPQIENPHLIYPGDIIYFRRNGEMNMPGDENAGRRRNAGAGNGDGYGDGGDGYGDGSEYEDEGETDALAQTGKTLDATPENYKDFVKLGGKYRVDRFKQVDDTIMDVVQKGFIGNVEEDELAKIVGSFEPKELLATGDNIYVEIGDNKDDKDDKDKKDKKDNKKKPADFQIGDYVEIIHIRDKIKHPDTGDKIGSIVDIVGRGKVLDIGKKKNDDDDDETRIATVKIVKAYDAIERGFHVREYVEQEKNVPLKETESDIKAKILTGYDPTFYYGPNFIVYLDKGSDDGVEPGIMLSVYRKGDGLREFEGKSSPANLPWEIIGELVVIRADEKTSVAVITNSIQALEAGDSAITGEIEE
ncbi:LysM peptidoglycan-binding domain-containing protein [bacterium]|nr:LysM peptidoglycan-binding domain-containing protein [bacterium]